MRSIFNKIKRNNTVLRPIDIGGTSRPDAPQAVVSLQGVTENDVGVANGVVPLNANNLVPDEYLPQMNGVSTPFIDGPLSVYTETITQFEITNFDFKREYVISAIDGDISFNSTTGIITYTAPLTAGQGGFVINGRQIPITILESVVAKPILLAPLNASVNAIKSVIAVAQQPIVLGHEMTNYTWSLEFQLADNAEFNLNTRFSTTANLDTLFDFINANQLYYVRVRASVPGQYAVSEWSDAIAFTTPEHFSPLQLTNYLIPTSTLINDQEFGNSIVLSNDGTILVVADRYGIQKNRISPIDTSIGTGLIYFYIRNENNWQLLHLLDFTSTGQSGNNDAYFGTSIGLSNDKQTLVVTSGIKLYVYKTAIVNDYTSLALIASIVDPATRHGGGFGSFVNMSDDAGLIIISQQNALSNVWYTDLDAYATSIFSFDGTNLTKLSQITNPWTSFYAGISGDGSRIIVGTTFNAAGFNMPAKVKIYDRDQNTWNLSSTIDPDNTNTDKMLVEINYLGNEIAFLTFETNSYFIYFFSLINEAWTRTHKIALPDTPLNGFSGQLWIDRIRFSKDGKSLLVRGAHDHVYLLTKTLSTWAIKTIYDISNVIADEYPGRPGFGSDFDISEYGDVVVIGSAYKNAPLATIDNQQVGAVFTYG